MSLYVDRQDIEGAAVVAGLRIRVGEFVLGAIRSRGSAVISKTGRRDETRVFP